MVPQIIAQRRRASFRKERLQHHILAAPFREVWTVFFAQGCDRSTSLLTFDSAAFVAMTLIEAGP
jgi:hypothetical protein